jgi:hypothetical protein
VNPAATVNAGIDTTYCVNVVSFPDAGIAANAASVTWTTSGDGTFSDANALNNSYTPGTGDRTTGSVTLTLTASPVSPCTDAVTDTRHILFDPCSGIPGNSSDQVSMRSYPNPSQGIFNLLMGGLKNQDTRITVFDMQGKEIFSEMISGKSTCPAIIDLSGFPKGIYTLKALTGQKVLVEKIIIQ